MIVTNPNQGGNDDENQPDMPFTEVNGNLWAIDYENNSGILLSSDEVKWDSIQSDN